MFWKKKRKIETQACFWSNDGGCAEGFVADVKECVQQGGCALVINHFTLTHERVSEQLASEGIQTATLTSVDDLSADRIKSLCMGGLVVLVPFPLLRVAAPFPPTECSDASRGVIYVPEAHPTRDRDALAEQFAAGLPFESAVKSYVSLESPLMQAFGSERISALMEQLGLGEGDRLEHPFLTRALQKAQQRIEARIQDEKSAASQQEWFALNLP